LQNLGATAGQATLTIEGLEDQLGGFGDVSGLGCSARPQIQLSLFLLKPLSIVTRRRITGWRSNGSFLGRHHQGAESRHRAETEVSFKTMLRVASRGKAGVMPLDRSRMPTRFMVQTVCVNRIAIASAMTVPSAPH
jgi:hypothetical protein